MRFRDILKIIYKNSYRRMYKCGLFLFNLVEFYKVVCSLVRVDIFVRGEGIV